MAYVIIPLPMLCTGENILTKKGKMSDFNYYSKILTKILPKCKVCVSQIHRTVISTHCLLWICTQKYSPNCMIPVSKNTKFISFWGVHIPPQTSPARTSKQAFGSVMPHQIITKNVKDGSMPFVRRHLCWGRIWGRIWKMTYSGGEQFRFSWRIYTP